MKQELQPLYDKYVKGDEDLTDQEWELVDSLVEHISLYELAQQGRLKLVNAKQNTYNYVYSESVNQYIHKDVEYTLDDSRVFTTTIAFDRYDMGYWIVDGDTLDEESDLMFKYKFTETDLASVLDGLIYDLIKGNSNSDQAVTNEQMLAYQLRSILNISELTDKEISLALFRAQLELGKLNG